MFEADGFFEFILYFSNFEKVNLSPFIYVIRNKLPKISITLDFPEEFASLHQKNSMPYTYFKQFHLHLTFSILRQNQENKKYKGQLVSLLFEGVRYSE